MKLETKFEFAQLLAGEMAKNMSACEIYGMTYGCDGCPQYDSCETIKEINQEESK